MAETRRWSLGVRLAFVVMSAGGVAIAILLMPRFSAIHVYEHELKSAYGIVEGAGMPGHEEEAQRAIDLVEKGDFQPAETVYRAIIQSSPQMYQAHHGLGSVLTYEGKYAEAETEFGTAIQIAPNFAPSYAGLGAIAAIRKDYTTSVRQHLKALSIDPQYGLSYWGVGAAYYAMRDCASAVPYLKRVPGLLPDSLYANKALHYVQRCSQGG